MAGPPMDEQLIALYDRHVGMAFDRQQRLADFLEKKAPDDDWEFDVSTATLRFGKVSFEAPLIGSHATGNNSWLWAWANKHMKLTVTNRALGTAMRAVLHKAGIHHLGVEGFALEPLLGAELTQSAAHILGVVLVGEMGYDAYYTMPYEGGRALTLIRDDRLKVVEKRPLVRVTMMFPQALQSMPVLNHKAALTAYARDYNLHVSEVPEGLKFTGVGKDELTATFDGDGRLIGLHGVAVPEPPAAKKPKAKAKPAKKTATKKPTAKKPSKKATTNAAARVVAKKSATPAAAKKLVNKNKRPTTPKPENVIAKASKKPVKSQSVTKADSTKPTKTASRGKNR